MKKQPILAALVAITAVMTLSTLTAHAAAPAAQAETQRTLAIQLGAPFRDNAVLQREMKVPVWGWSKPGTKVTVEFAGQKKTAIAEKDGKWMVWLDPLKASFDPAEMVVTESTGKKVVLKNILVGEVWMASGQSNMQWMCTKSTCSRLKVDPVGEKNTNPIREFQVKSVAAQLHPIEKATGAWQDGGYGNYSAIAFAFAHKLYKELNVPIGILNCSWSSTQIEAWVPRQGWATAEDEYSKAIHQKCLMTDPATPEHKGAWAAFYKSLEDQITQSEALIKKGEKAKEIGAPVPGNMKSNRDASWLFNGRMNPVVPYAIRGAIWNQGWHNRGGGLSYYENLHSMIRGWRIVWDKPELPVYFHQFYCPDQTDKPGIDSTAEMRLGTWMARDIPGAGMASQIDIGGAIHYHCKAVPGRRLALHALKNQYGRKVVAEGPMFKSYEVQGDKAIVTFDCVEGGLVVADTAFNRSREEGATGLADPKVIENGEEKVKLFWLAGEDRAWHPASVEIHGDKVVVQSDAVKKPHGVSYGSGGIGFQPCLYNKAMLPMTPFIYFDGEMVTSKKWPDEKLKLAGSTADSAAEDDPSATGKIHEYRKMPLLSVQFRDNAVLQADKPVTIWGSTRNFGEWQSEPEEGDCKVHFEFGNIKKTIRVTPEMAEWKMTLPPMKAGPKPYTLKVGFTIDGELVHERVAAGIVFGDVWYVAAPAGKFEVPKVKPSGQIVRMIENQSMREGKDAASRFSVCVSRTPRKMQANGKWVGRFASYWKDASGLAAALGHSIAAKTNRPVGVILMQSKTNVPIKNWIAAGFLKDAPSLMKDYKTVGSKYFDNPYYLANVRRYVAEWKAYWGEYIPAMLETKAVPDGSSWGRYPSPKPQVGDSKATWTYNVYVHCFTPAALSGIVFLSSESMLADDQGANFGPEMSALANCFKTRFALGQDGEDIPFIYTVPSKTLAPKITQPKAIKGKSTAAEIGDWLELEKVIDAVAK